MKLSSRRWMNALFAGILCAAMLIGAMPVNALAEPEEAAGDEESAIIIELPEQTENVYYQEETPDEDTLNRNAEAIEYDPNADPFDFASEDSRMNLLSESESYPSKFDLRSVDTDGDGKADRCFVTPVKFQNPFGTCWGFAAIAAAESSILGSLLYDDPEAYKTLDLSEKQLTYFTHTYLDDPSSSQNGEGTHHFSIKSSSDIYTGGLPLMATATFSMGIGPVNESRGEDYIYKGKNGYTDQRMIDGSYKEFCYSAEDDWSMPEEDRFNQDYVLKESIMLPSPAGTNNSGEYEYNAAATAAMKEQLLNYRAIEIGFAADTSSPNQDIGEDGVYLSTKNWAHYTWNMDENANHAVTVIGWDDDYPKENFVEGYQPPENGAWLVKNSWGTGEREFPYYGSGKWGIKVPKSDENGDPVLDEHGDPVMVNSGYFWISYYDRTISMVEALVFDENKGDTKYYLDEYDFMQVNEITPFDVGDVEIKMANIFKAEGCESLKAVSCQTGSPNTKATIEVYLLSTDYKSPVDGFLMARIEQTFDYGGFHKVWLDEPILIQKGQAYSIVVSEQQEDGSYALNIPMGYGEKYPLVELTGGSYQVGVINKDESYLGINDDWKDYSDQEFRNDLFDLSEDSVSDLQFDNFPIKGFCSMMPYNINIRFAGSSEMLLFEGQDEASLSLRFTGDGGKPLGNPAIEWKLKEGGEEFVQMTPSENGTSVAFKALKIGKTYAAVTVEGVGTTVFPVIIGRLCPHFMIAFPEVYTGEPLTPQLYVLSPPPAGILLEEGVHYTATFENNILCGVVTVTIVGIGENFNPDGPLYGYTVIKPAKSVIRGIKAQGTSLIVSVEDQKESAISGYVVKYSKTGDSQQLQKEFGPDSPDLVLDGLEPNTEYNISVSAFVDIPEDMRDKVSAPRYYSADGEAETGTTGEEKVPAAVTRIYGGNRYTTSLAIADKLKEAIGGAAFNAVVLATGANFPDALAGGYLASLNNAPIILINEKKAGEVTDYIKANLASGGTVYVLGGPSAVADSWLAALNGYTITRLDGADVSDKKNRYTTNLSILKAAGVKAGDDILVATGKNYADALSASSVPMPILLVDMDKNVIRDDQKEFMSTLNGSHFHILGAENAVSAELEAALKEYGTVDRTAGGNRRETSVKIAETFVGSPKGVALAYAQDFPDGLCGGPLAIRLGMPLILTQTGNYTRVDGSQAPRTDAATEYVAANKLRTGVVFGGEKTGSGTELVTNDAVKTIVDSEVQIDEYKK